MMFVEASTLNVSEADKKAIQQGCSVPLNHRHTIERALRKTICDKADQLYVEFSAKAPSVLVLFDYTTFSGYATGFYHVLAQHLFGEHLGFLKLPAELSALIYLERKILDGRICISKIRSAVYHNPNAAYKITDSVFGMFTQFAMRKIEMPPRDECAVHDAWFCPGQLP